ncbi:restriction endonuclease subunit S [Marinomonas sp.]
MGSSWKKTSLMELGVELIDCDHKTPKAVEKGVPYIGIPQMDRGKINFSANPRLISEDDFLKWTRKANPMYGDVILSRRCNSGETVYVPKESKFALGQNLVLLRPTGNRMHPEYLRWAVQGREWWNEVAKYLNPGAIFESLKCRDIPKFKIPEPPKSIQIKISKILSDIENKIELNSQINQTLEQMAQALFKSWFVDFDPVIDNALDAGNPIPNALAERAARRQAARASDDFQPLPDDVRQLFPSEFEDSELGWIPKGWGIKALKKLVDISSSKRIFSKEYQDKGIPFYRGKEISELSKGRRVQSDIFISEDRFNEFQDKYGVPKEGDILITSVGTIGNTYLVEKSDRFYFKDGNLTWIKAYHDLFIPHYFIEWFKSSHGKEIIESIKIGTTQQAITINSLNSIKILQANSSVHELFEEHVRSIFLKVRLNNTESNNLEDIRDTLLPKLISGELRLDSPEVEQAKSLLDGE